MHFSKIKILILFICVGQFVLAQNRGAINWSADGNTYTMVKDGNIVQVDPKHDGETVISQKRTADRTRIKKIPGSSILYV